MQCIKGIMYVLLAWFFFSFSPEVTNGSNNLNVKIVWAYVTYGENFTETLEYFDFDDLKLILKKFVSYHFDISKFLYGRSIWNGRCQQLKNNGFSCWKILFQEEI